MPRPPKPECVLIVENDQQIAQDIALRIAELGYGIAGIMSSVEEALEKIKQLKPDLILIDFMIAGSMNAIETAGKIRLTANIPVIFLTGNSDHEAVARALTGSPFAWLQTPVNERELELKLELTLLRHRMEEQTRITRMTLERRVSEITRELDSSKQALQKLVTQRHRDQTSLQRFSDALEDSSDSIYLIDRVSMRFIDVNQTACERSGYSREELLEMGPHDIKPSFNRQMLEHEFDKIAATQNRFGIIYTIHKCKNNEIYPVEVRLRASEAEARAIIVAIARDMTLHHQNEKALRQSEEQFRQISQNLQHVLWIRDIETEQVIYISSAFEKIWGRPVEQVYELPRMLFADIHPDDRERVTSSMQRMWGDNHDMDAEYRLLRSDGQIRWLWTRTFAIRDDEGKVYRIGGMTEDITTRKDDEEKLRLSEEKFHLLFERSPIGIGLLSINRQITEINPAFCNMLGYSHDELIGKNINDITYPDDRNISTEYTEKLFDGATPSYTIEKRYMRKDGSPLWARSTATIIRDHHQRPLYGLGMIQDIDEMKQAETVRLAHESAQKKALVREVHHRIKNHLQGVTGLMYQHAMNNSHCSKVIEEAIAQINVVATIHGLQGKESGEDIDLLQMLTAISQSLKEFMPTRAISPICITGDLSPYLNRDESVPVALALNELMVNAAKHGGEPMKISLHCNNDRALIRIENRSVQTMTKILPGSGLELVKGLLLTEGASFRYEYIDQRFLAEIILTPPVIQLQRTTK
jgi:PAS domain S-box-containing protein